MIRRADFTASDANGTPEPGVYITVKTNTGALATLFNDNGSSLSNPFQSGTLGAFVYNVATEGVYTEEYRLSLSDSPRKIIELELSLSGLDGLLVNAPSLIVPIGTDMVATVGADALDHGGANYVAGTAPTARSGFTSANGRNFVLSKEQVIVPQMFYQATDSSFGQAIQAAVDYLRTTGINGGIDDHYRGSVPLIIPNGSYTSNISIDIQHSLDTRGDGEGEGASAFGNTHIHFVGCDGFRLQSPDTTGTNGVRDLTSQPGVGRARLRGMMLTSDLTAGKHAIVQRAIADIEHIYARGWGGLAVRCWTGNARGAAYGGNTSTSTIKCVKGENCQGTLSVGGTDSNLIQVDGCQGWQNRQFAVEDFNAAGANKHRGWHCTYNGFTTRPGIDSFTMCSQSGNIYTPNIACVDFTSPSATSALLAAHAPSGTTAHNGYWLYQGAGGPTAYSPAYASGGPWTYGGDMFAMSPYSTEYDSCYQEGGGGLSQSLYRQPVWNGGSIDPTQLYGGTLLKSTDDAYEIIRTAGGINVTLRGANGGAGTIALKDLANVLRWSLYHPFGGGAYYFTPQSHNFRTGTEASPVNVGFFDPSGVGLYAGQAFSINGVNVLSGQMAAIADLGAAPTQADFNGLLAKLRAVALLHA